MLAKICSAALLASATLLFLPSSAHAETVTASYYSNRYNGRTTAGHQRFNNNALTAASKTLPIGSKVKLTNPKNHRSVIVRVNDRGPFVKGRDISVTRRAAKNLGFVRSGVTQLEMEPLDGSDAKRTSKK